jgi:hypothetical protein
MNTPHTVSDDRLAQIVDGDVTAFAYEVPAIAAELLARRAGDRQREELIERMQKIRAIMECNDPTNARELFGEPK